MQNDHVSVDEAVARLLNLDFVPAPYTVIELLEGFLLQAQEKFERIPAGTGNQIERNSHRAVMKVCESRLDSGKVLVEAIESEIKQGNLIAKSTTSSVQLLSWSAIRAWAEEMFGLTVIERIVAPEAKPAGGGAPMFADDDPVTVLDKELAGWKHKKLRYLLENFYVLALEVAHKHRKTMLTASGDVEIKPLSEEIEAIIKKWIGVAGIKNHEAQTIKRRLMTARTAWNQAVDGVKRSGK